MEAAGGSNGQRSSDPVSSLLWFRSNGEVMEHDSGIVEQFVENVEDFSSQYGSEISVSYTAFNIRGPPSNFPDYGDYPQAFVMRTYGEWWSNAPSAEDNYMPQNKPSIPSHDYVEVSYKRAVYPLQVSIFETYNPGAVVRIWAWANEMWMLLWEGKPQRISEKPRIYSPPIKQIDYPTRILRLEFNHAELPYYTELDAILLKGRQAEQDEQVKNDFAYSSLLYKPEPVVEKGSILNSVIASNLHERIVSTVQGQATKTEKNPEGYFQRLPDEVILCVFGFLDIKSLFRCAQVNKHFRNLTSDMVLYKTLDLKPYWHSVTSQVLETFSHRCKYLKKLDLSWCGSHDLVKPQDMVNFLVNSGAELTHLRLNCCNFVDSSVFKAIGQTSRSLQELGLRAANGSESDWMALSTLTQLQKVDFYRTNINTAAVTAIVQANNQLRHVNFGSCRMITSMDEVAMNLGAHCPDLISVDFWKSYSLSARGMKALGQCKRLQEIDIGWCLQAGASGDWVSHLAATELRKLFVGALRGICDRHLRDLIGRAPHLEQLDLLGLRSISPEICEAILTECKELKLLDISFCDQIQEAMVDDWNQRFPNVSVKRSYQSTAATIAPSSLFLAPSLEVKLKHSGVMYCTARCV